MAATIGFAFLGFAAAFLALAWASSPILVWEYHALIGRARDERAIARGTAVCSLTFAASNFAFALMYTGIWR